jgi:hypothetical protein
MLAETIQIACTVATPLLSIAVVYMYARRGAITSDEELVYIRQLKDAHNARFEMLHKYNEMMLHNEAEMRKKDDHAQKLTDQIAALHRLYMLAMQQS